MDSHFTPSPPTAVTCDGALAGATVGADASDLATPASPILTGRFKWRVSVPSFSDVWRASSLMPSGGNPSPLFTSASSPAISA